MTAKEIINDIQQKTHEFDLAYPKLEKNADMNIVQVQRSWTIAAVPTLQVFEERGPKHLKKFPYHIETMAKAREVATGLLSGREYGYSMGDIARFVANIRSEPLYLIVYCTDSF